MLRLFAILFAIVFSFSVEAANGAGTGKYGGTVALGSRSSSIIGDGTFSSQPGIGVIKKDWRLVAAYSYGAAADFENNNVVKVVTSNDLGVSWSTASVIVTPPTNYTALFGDITVLSDDTICLTYMNEPNDGSGISLATTVVYLIKGTVAAAGAAIVWGSPIAIATGSPFGGSGVFSAAAVVELSTGVNDLMIPVYGGATTFGMGAYFSADKGNTWGTFTVIIAPDPTNVDQWDEADCRVIPAGQPAGNAGRIYCIVRHDLPNTAGYDLIYTDVVTGKSGWTAPVTVLFNPLADLDGRPSLALHPTGGLFLIARWSNNPATAFWISWPDSAGILGKVWSATQFYGNSASPYPQNWYNSCTILPDHSIGCAIARAIGSAPITTEIKFQQFILQVP